MIPHLTATLITGWWLARGEAALWALLQAAGERLGALFCLLLPAALPLAPPATAFPPVMVIPAARLLRHTVSRRGPPLPAV